MGLKVYLSLLLIFSYSYSLAQYEIFRVSQMFTLEKLRSIEEIEFKWDMPGRVQLNINEGLNNLANDNPERAIRNFTEAIKEDTASWIAHYYRAGAYKMINQFDEAEIGFKEVQKITSENYKVWIELGKTYHLQSKTTKAIEAYSIASEINANNPTALYLLGELTMQTNDISNAKNYFLKCIELDKKHADAKIKLGLINIIETSKIESGMIYLNDILSDDPLNFEALTFRSLLKAKINPKASLEDITKVIEFDPINPFYRMHRNLILIDLKQYEKAFFDIIKILQSIPEDEGEFLAQQTFFDKKIDLQNASYYIIDKIFGLEDKDADKIKKAYCLIVVGNHDEAKISLTKFKKYKSSALCLYLLGITNEHQGYHETAWTYYESAIKLDPDITDAHKKIGIYHSNVDHWDKAERSFTTALTLNKDLKNLYKLRGVARYFSANYMGAIDDFTKVLETDSTDRQALESRAFSYEKIGEKYKAAEDRLSMSHSLSSAYNIFESALNFFLERGDTAKVLHHLNRYNENHIEPKAFYLKFKLLQDLNRWDSISNEIDVALIKLNKGYYTYEFSYLLYLKGLLLLKHNDEKNAEDYFTRAINIYNKNGKAFLERGRIYMNSGKLILAEKDLKQALNLGIKEASELLKITAYN